MNEVNNIDPQLHSIFVSKFCDALDTRSFHEYFTFVDEQIKNKLLPANYISEKNGEFMGKFFECWQVAKQNAVRFLTHTGMQPIHRTHYQRICNIIATTGEINLRQVCALKMESLLLDTCRNTGNDSFVRVLLELGTNVNSVDHDGYSALHWAVSEGNIEAARSLVERGANINSTTTTFHQSPLLLATQEGYVDAMRMLLDAGADINQTDCFGQTSLSIASRNGHIEAVRLLLERGAKISNSAISRAEENPEIHALLKQTKIERAEKAKRKQEATVFMNAATKSKSTLFNQIPQSAKCLVGRMVKTASTPRAV